MLNCGSPSRLLGGFQGDALDIFTIARQVVQSQVVKIDVEYLGGNIPGGFETQGKVAHIITLGLRQFLGRHAVVPDILHHLADFLDYLGRVFRRGKGGDDERARGPPEKEAAADAIGETQVGADASHEAGRKAALTQDIVD